MLTWYSTDRFHSLYIFWLESSELFTGRQRFANPQRKFTRSRDRAYGFSRVGRNSALQDSPPTRGTAEVTHRTAQRTGGRRSCRTEDATLLLASLLSFPN